LEGFSGDGAALKPCKAGAGIELGSAGIEHHAASSSQAMAGS
jgi:hypothetical protein